MKSAFAAMATALLAGCAGQGRGLASVHPRCGGQTSGCPVAIEGDRRVSLPEQHHGQADASTLSPPDSSEQDASDAGLSSRHTGDGNVRGECEPPYPRPTCVTPLDPRWTGVWIDGRGNAILVDSCGVYMPPPWNSARMSLWQSDAPAFRWAIESASPSEVVLVLVGERTTMRSGPHASELEYIRGRSSHRYTRAEPGRCHWIQSAEFGIEPLTAEDFRWFADVTR